MARAREEVAAVARKYNPHSESSLVDQLSNIPVEAWEMEFTFLDCCLKDSIRLQSLGTAFRKNIGGENIRIGDEIIPPGTFIVSFGLLYSSNGMSSIQSAPTNSFLFLPRHIISGRPIRILLSIPTQSSGILHATSPSAPRTGKCHMGMWVGAPEGIRASA
jgi:hypothetical protein